MGPGLPSDILTIIPGPLTDRRKRYEISHKGLSGNHFTELPRSVLSGRKTRQRCYLESVES